MFNFEEESSPNLETNLEGFKQRPILAPYIHSCQPGIWRREKLINELQIPQNPWEWELSSVYTLDNYYINSSGQPIIDVVNGLIRGK